MTNLLAGCRGSGDIEGLDAEPTSYSSVSAQRLSVEEFSSPALSLPAKVAEILGRRIVLEFAPNGLGVPTESELCRQYGASRTAVREAMKHLIAQGLVSVGPRRGTQVRPEIEWSVLHPQVLGWLSERNPTDNLLLEFLELRLGVEPAAAALAAQNASNDDHRAIRQALDEMEAAQDDQARHLMSDIAFHRAVLNATANRFYAQLSAVTQASLELAIRRAHSLNLPATSLADHAKIGQAILRHDAVGAADAMRTHLLTALQHMKERLHCGEVRPRRDDQ